MNRPPKLRRRLSVTGRLCRGVGWVTLVPLMVFAVGCSSSVHRLPWWAISSPVSGPISAQERPAPGM